MRILIGLCLLGSLHIQSMDIRSDSPRKKASPGKRQTSPRERPKIEVPAANLAVPGRGHTRLKSVGDVEKQTIAALIADSPRLNPPVKEVKSKSPTQIVMTTKKKNN
jgi:hypothetical protein